MRVFVADSDRVGLDFALRCAVQGHDVRLFRPPGVDVKDGYGFSGIVITRDLKDSLKWARDGLVVTTCNEKYLDEIDRWRDFGCPVFGPTKASAKLEIDRGHGMQVMKMHDMDMPKYHEFKSLEDALIFAKKADQPYVHKPLGSESDKSLTFVPKDPAQLVGWLERKIKSGMKIKGSCMLQEKVQDMVAEVGIAAWMGKDGFLREKNEISFEFKKLMADDFGPSTGEQGTVTQYVKESKLADILMRFESHFRALGHTGDVAINGAIDGKGNYLPFEFTCRAGWPDFFIRTSLTKGDHAQWMKDALEGKDTLKVSYDVAIGVVVAQKPYPYEDGLPEITEGNPIYGVDEVAEHIHFAQVMMGRGPVWDGKKTVEEKLPLTSGSYVLVATGHGKTVCDAKRSVDDVIDHISLPDMLVRCDIGDKLERQLPKLHDLGFDEMPQWE